MCTEELSLPDTCSPNYRHCRNSKPETVTGGFNRPRTDRICRQKFRRERAAGGAAGHTAASHEVDSRVSPAPGMSRGELECGLRCHRITCLWFHDKGSCSKIGMHLCQTPHPVTTSPGKSISRCLPRKRQLVHADLLPNVRAASPSHTKLLLAQPSGTGQWRSSRGRHTKNTPNGVHANWGTPEHAAESKGPCPEGHSCVNPCV